MTDILVLNGPNLNLLGTREVEIYGEMTLPELESMLQNMAETNGVELECFQSNHEGALIDAIHAAVEKGVEFILINAGAYAHTSIAIRDALAAVEIPFVEIHMSNTADREAFRQESFLSELAWGTITGFGHLSYALAFFAAAQSLAENAEESE